MRTALRRAWLSITPGGARLLAGWLVCVVLSACAHATPPPPAEHACMQSMHATPPPAELLLSCGAGDSCSAGESTSAGGMGAWQLAPSSRRLARPRPRRLLSCRRLEAAARARRRTALLLWRRPSLRPQPQRDHPAHLQLAAGPLMRPRSVARRCQGRCCCGSVRRQGGQAHGRRGRRGRAPQPARAGWRQVVLLAAQVPDCPICLPAAFDKPMT